MLCSYYFPHSIRTGATVTALSPGYDHMCVLTSLGGVSCWGNNGNGQVGIGSTNSDVLSPSSVNLGSGWLREIRGYLKGEGFFCALDHDFLKSMRINSCSLRRRFFAYPFTLISAELQKKKFIMLVSKGCRCCALFHTLSCSGQQCVQIKFHLRPD